MKFLPISAIALFLLPCHLSAMEHSESPKTPQAAASSSTQEPTTQDNFDFLGKKYPKLLKKSTELFTLCHEEKKHYEKLKSIGGEESLLKHIKHYLSTKLPSNCQQEMIDSLKPNHPQYGYFKTFFSRSLEEHTLTENIMLAAEYISQVVADEGGGTIVSLGRSPCLIALAYEELQKAKKDEIQTLVHLNFSGHPDSLTRRELPFFKTETNITRDIVTTEKLEHYFSYLDQKDILKSNKLFILDIMGSGGGLSSFLRIMKAYYQNRQSTMPPLSFLILTNDMDWSNSKNLPENYTFANTGAVNNHGLLTLTGDTLKNINPFQVPTYGIPIFGWTITEILDKDMFQELLVHGIQYPAQKWTPQFDTQREQGGLYHSKFYEYLRGEFSGIIAKHQNSNN